MRPLRSFWHEISIQTDPFDAHTEEIKILEKSHNSGALVTFQGLVRGFDGLETLQALFLEHMPVVTENEIRKIVFIAQERFEISGCRIIHRIGRLEKNEKIVLIMTCATHRQTAFEAAEFIMDYLKTQAPFWKQEIFENGQHHWVTAKKKDDDALVRWQK